VTGNLDQIPLPPKAVERPPDLRLDRPAELWRLHWESDPSSPEPKDPGRWRFDAPHAEYPVTYANRERHHIFVEVYGDTDDHREIQPDQADRKISVASLNRPLRLIDLGDAETLAHLRLDSRVSTTIEYSRTQLWSRTLHDSLPYADAIRYPGRKAGREDNFCLFLDRCKDALVWNLVGTIATERALVLSACMKFDITARVYLEGPPTEAWPSE
jgi:hypothetical protein